MKSVPTSFSSSNLNPFEINTLSWHQPSDDKDPLLKIEMLRTKLFRAEQGQRITAAVNDGSRGYWIVRDKKTQENTLYHLSNEGRLSQHQISFCNSKITCLALHNDMLYCGADNTVYKLSVENQTTVLNTRTIDNIKIKKMCVAEEDLVVILPFTSFPNCMKPADVTLGLYHFDVSVEPRFVPTSAVTCDLQYANGCVWTTNLANLGRHQTRSYYGSTISQIPLSDFTADGKVNTRTQVTFNDRVYTQIAKINKETLLCWERRDALIVPTKQMLSTNSCTVLASKENVIYAGGSSDNALIAVHPKQTNFYTTAGRSILDVKNQPDMRSPVKMKELLLMRDPRWPTRIKQLWADNNRVFTLGGKTVRCLFLKEKAG